MGQSVAVRSTVTVGDSLLLDTDRSFTGQDGQVMTLAEPGGAVGGKLAGRLFDLGIGIDHVYVLQNTVSVRRPGGWDETAVAAVEQTTTHFLRFYDD